MTILLLFFSLFRAAAAESVNNPYDAGKEIQAILLDGKTGLGEKKRLIDAYTKIPNSEVKGIACVTLAAIGEKNIEDVALPLLKDKDYRAMNAGALCLALTGKANAVSQIAPLISHKHDLVRNHAAVLLAKLNDNPKAAAAMILALKEKEKTSHIPFNMIQAIRHWSEPTLLDALASYSSSYLKSGKFFNAEGIARIFVFTADVNPKTFEHIKLAMSKTKNMSSIITGATPGPYVKPSEKVRELIEGCLLNKKISTIEKNGLANSLVSFRNPKTLDVFEKVLQTCEDLVCEDVVWSAAAFPGKKAQEIVTKAVKHRDPGTAKAARAILEYWKVKNKDQLITQLLNTDVREQGKLNFDKFDNRNELVQLASRDENGIGRETIEMALKTYENTMALPLEELVKGYLWRFGSDPRVPLLFAGQLDDSSLVRKMLLQFLEDRADATTCTALYNFYLRKSDQLFSAEETLMKIAGLRQQGLCPAPGS